MNIVDLYIQEVLLKEYKGDTFPQRLKYQQDIIFIKGDYKDSIGNSYDYFTYKNRDGNQGLISREDVIKLKIDNPSKRILIINPDKMNKIVGITLKNEIIRYLTNTNDLNDDDFKSTNNNWW